MNNFKRDERNRALTRWAHHLNAALDHLALVRSEAHTMGFTLPLLDDRTIRAALDHCAHVYQQKGVNSE